MPTRLLVTVVLAVGIFGGVIRSAQATFPGDVGRLAFGIRGADGNVAIGLSDWGLDTGESLRVLARQMAGEDDTEKLLDTRYERYRHLGVYEEAGATRS